MDAINVRPKGVKRPKTLICYICGREYGTKSLEIHLKACEKKWNIEQQNLPKNKRKNCPTAPPGFFNMIRMAQGLNPLDEEGNEISKSAYQNNGYDNGGALSGNGKYLDPSQAIDLYNEKAYQNWDQNVLEPCPHCNRTFKPESLKFHLKACKADKPLKKPIIRSVGENGEKIVKYQDQEDQKIPHLGLAARAAAQEKQGRFQDIQKPNFQNQNNIGDQKMNPQFQQNISKNNQYGDNQNSKINNQKRKSIIIAQNQGENQNQQQEKKSKWKEERENFMKAIKLGKQINSLEQNPDLKNNKELQNKIRELASQIPNQLTDANMKQCPHCMRKFNFQAAERHIPSCQNVQNRPKPPPSYKQIQETIEMRKNAYGGEPQRKYQMPNIYSSPEKSQNKILLNQHGSNGNNYNNNKDVSNFRIQLQETQQSNNQYDFQNESRLRQKSYIGNSNQKPYTNEYNNRNYGSQQDNQFQGNVNEKILQSRSPGVVKHKFLQYQEDDASSQSLYANRQTGQSLPSLNERSNMSESKLKQPTKIQKSYNLQSSSNYGNQFPSQQSSNMSLGSIRQQQSQKILSTAANNIFNNQSPQMKSTNSLNGQNQLGLKVFNKKTGQLEIADNQQYSPERGQQQFANQMKNNYQRQQDNLNIQEMNYHNFENQQQNQYNQKQQSLYNNQGSRNLKGFQNNQGDKSHYSYQQNIKNEYNYM